MADLGNIATILNYPHETIYSYQDNALYKLESKPIYTDRNGYTRSHSNQLFQALPMHDVGLNSVFDVNKIRLYTFTKLTYKWFVDSGSNTTYIDVQQSESNDYDTIIEVLTPEGKTTFTGNKTLTSKQTIEVTYNNIHNRMFIDVMLSYKFTNSVRRTDRYVDWYIPEVTRELNDLSSLGISSYGSLNCSYPIGEERPIDYGNISLTASTTTTITFTIPANTVTSTTTDAQILLTLSDYGSNLNGDIEDIFTALGTSWFKMYVYDGATSLKIDVESWNSVDNYAKVWVTIPSLTVASKDIVLHHDITDLDNTDSTILTVIGF